MTDLRIAKPCHENWNAMTPGEQGRHCAVCDKSVVDVTTMKPVEGRRFLGKLRDDLSAGAHVCVRAHADAAGRLLAPSATRRLLTNGLAAVIAVAFAGCQGNGPAVGQQPGSQPGQAQTEQPGQVRQDPRPQTMGEPEAKLPVECIQGDVAVAQPMGLVEQAPPKPEPQPEPQPMLGSPVPVQAEMGRVSAPPQPAPQPLMGKPVALPRVVKGEASAAVPAPAPIETMGKVAAPVEVDR